MATPEYIREGLKQIASSHAPAVSNIAQVKSVNEEKATCILIDEDGQEYLDVRLRPVLTGNKSFIQIPKVGSYVLAVRVEDDDDWMIIACDVVEKFYWKTESANLELSDKIHMEANGKNFAKLVDTLFDAIRDMKFTTNYGPTINLINLQDFEKLRNEFKSLLK
ncbi:hypothetical protein C1637_18570 [Chryseobacterium lactis]|uniref:Uncharacterized protein n=1 Tax=Chryseobacterium lactis TaxID=1241981 RepID=A0A3G6RTH2_CHRLC|nr:hypothetical protein [Chryseobacterium lactis]AZA84787.1 hypothetical protein EG342_24080 [Chryseobacterium lactis]AZB05176.1 hypothetical protein EG341_14960 [Chryseobacterium lactis]PNW12158.1 hypothetical protein C1637_18570 [Chryseobacterium lactis]